LGLPLRSFRKSGLLDSEEDNELDSNNQQMQWDIKKWKGPCSGKTPGQPYEGDLGLQKTLLPSREGWSLQKAPFCQYLVTNPEERGLRRKNKRSTPSLEEATKGTMRMGPLEERKLN